ncbi:5-methylcytosine restriction system specificity protein McrC [Formosa sp. PL04]|uniref:McrC family protein n=1 Tax=Formosa sp. PL04 TaxID=3081755 RepID=UPI002981E1D8|nr:restriction endonuclease [Formosa sp. PL04]MDW5288878.1 restriction endonuclease [Formosa sp. PL04]
MQNPIQVFEFEKLVASDTSFFKTEALGKKVIDKLWLFNDANKNIYFEAIRNGVKFKNYVGVIQIGNVTIEILPKADRQSSNQNERGQWHSVLLKMLAQCKKIKVDSVSKAALKKRHHSLLDLYFDLFLDEVNMLLSRGLIKQYRKQSGNVLALKGRLDFSKNIQHNLVHKERFYTNHQVYDYNHLINQILLKALLVLKKTSNNISINDKIERILSCFPEVKEIKINKSHFDKLTANRKTTDYQEAIKIAKMILLNYSPDIKGGSENMLALLFDMNMLWEEYVYRMLAKTQTEKMKVKFQNRKPFWDTKVIKPDIVIEKTEENNTVSKYVIDTKWKIINPKQPGDNDLKQMYAYNMYWEANKSMLLYPTSEYCMTDFGKFHKGRTEENQCKLGFIKVMDNDTLNKNIGTDILNLLEIEC